MMQVRLEYSVGPEVRYLSHLDFLRLFIRALRRAGLPVAYSRGFSPHPKLAFGPPLSVGVTSSREYLDLELQETVPVARLVEKLRIALPQGVDIRRAQEIKEKATPLMAVIERAEYRVAVALTNPVEEADWNEKLAHFLTRSSIVVDRKTKEGLRPKEIRPGIFRLEGEQAHGAAFFRMELQTGSRGTVRPDEVIRGLIELEGMPLNQEEMQITRTGLFALKDSEPVTPLEIL